MKRHARRRDVLLPHQPRAGGRPQRGRAAERLHAVTVTIPSGPTGPGGTVTVYNLTPALARPQRQHPRQRAVSRHGLQRRRADADQALLGPLADGGRPDDREERGRRAGRDRAQRSQRPEQPTNFPKASSATTRSRASALSGSYRLPWDVNAGRVDRLEQRLPVPSTYQVTRAVAAPQGITLTRASQTIALSERGDERLPNVTMVDLRLSRPFRFGGAQFTPQLDIFNIGNASTVVAAQRRRRDLPGAARDPRAADHPRRVQSGFLTRSEIRY